MSTTLPSAAPRRIRPGTRIRWDVQGLRAFAVLAVVLYHLWPNRLPGGFVGVDVFFVISGYLITGHLLRELVADGRIRLAAFWSRRARRLLPAAFLAIVATGIAVLVWVPWSLWGQYGRELIAATVYVQNWQLAADSVDYLAQGNAPSPFQHFWSLSVEEQFYIALPLVLLAATATTRHLLRRGWSTTAVTRTVLAAVAALSLAWSVTQTTTDPGIAYFSTATRAWEFALGGLAATITLPVPRTAVARSVRVVGAWAGAVGLVVAVVVITPSMPFPGVVAALPVVSATLVVLFGAHAGMQGLGRWRPVAFTGRISYAVYLWHWPAIVILPIALGHDLTTKDKVAIIVGTAVVASASTLLVEEPLRVVRRARAVRPRRVALLAVAASVAVLALGAGTLTGAHVQRAEAAAFAHRLAAADVPCYGAAALVGSATPCVDPRLADVRVPYGENPNRAACWSSGDDSALNVCTIGPRTGARKHLLAIGDSHSNALLPAYERIARDRHWRIDLMGHSGCYLTTARQTNISDGFIAACDAWKAKAFAYVRAHTHVDAVVVTHSTGNTPVIPPPGVTVEDATVAGLAEAWRQVTALGVPVIAIRDNAVSANPDVTTCVAAMQGPTTGVCDTPRDQALRFDGSAEAMQGIDDARLIDLTDLYCTATVCPEVIGGVVVHRDPSHLTDRFAATLAPYLGRDIAKALRSLGR